MSDRRRRSSNKCINLTRPRAGISFMGTARRLCTPRWVDRSDTVVWRRSELVLLLLAWLLLAGCAGDRFAGSWATTGTKDHGRDLVIAKTAEGYQAAFLVGDDSTGWLPLKQNGDTLKGTWHVSATDGSKASTAWLSLTYEDGTLVYRDSTFSATMPWRFTRVNDKTTAPTSLIPPE